MGEENPAGGEPLDLPKLAGIAVGIGFAIGLLYNLGFFLEIDARLFPLLSYKDHLETLVIFAPIAIAPILLLVGYRATAARRRTASVIAITLAIIAVTVWFERGAIAGSPQLAAAEVWAVSLVAFLLVAYCAAVILDRGLAVNETPTNVQDREASFRALTFAIVGLLAFVTLLGATQAGLAMQQGRFDTQITFAGEGPAAAVRQGRVVRVLDSGLLVVFADAPGQMAYVRMDAIRSLAEPTRP